MKKGQELITFLFFLFVSGCFWMIQALNETCEVYVQVPLQLVNRPGDVIVLTPPPEEITISVQNKGLSLWRLLLNPRMKGIDFDFNSICGQRNAAHVRITSKQIWDSLQVTLPTSTKLIGVITPDSVTFDYNRGQNSILPVRFAGSLTPAQHYAIESCTVEPQQIKVYANDSKRSLMEDVPVGATVSIADLKQSGSRNIDLVAPEGVSYSPSRVQLTYKVVPLVKKSIRVPVKPQNFPAGKDLRTFPSHLNVTYWMQQEDANNSITSDSFYVSVTYEEVLKSKEKLRPRLHSKPSRASDVTITPAEVDFVIEDVETDD